MQAEGELSSLKVGRVPVVTAGGSPVFLPLSREDQTGQLNPHLPVIILEPTRLVQAPLLTGETSTHNSIDNYIHTNVAYVHACVVVKTSTPKDVETLIS